MAASLKASAQTRPSFCASPVALPSNLPCLGHSHTGKASVSPKSPPTPPQTLHPPPQTHTHTIMYMRVLARTCVRRGTHMRTRPHTHTHTHTYTHPHTHTPTHPHTHTSPHMGARVRLQTPQIYAGHAFGNLGFS
jgi:hypothetical protein